MIHRNASVVCFLLSLLVTSSSAQPLERLSGTKSEIRNVIMKSNNVTFIMYNYGQFARPNTLAGVADFVWKGLGYMYEFGPLLSAEVTDTSSQTVHILDDGLWLPAQGGYSPDGVTKWGWLPRAGYAQPGSPTIPTARDTANWPSSWSAWPARQGTELTGGSNEAYYVMDDFTNAKYSYFPFPDDSSKRGLGVSAQVWTTQYAGGLQDAVIITWRLKNESPRSLPKCYFGFYGDPHIGGATDYNDDLANFVDTIGPAGDPRHYQARNTVYVYDADGVGQGGLPAGYMSLKFLRTPGNRDLTAFSALPYTNAFPNVPKNDTFFSRLLAADSIDRGQYLFTNPGDNVLLFGTGPFSLNAGDSTEIVLSIFFSRSFSDMLDDATYIYYASHWPSITSIPGAAAGDPSCAIQITSPHADTVAGDIPVTWSFGGTDPTAKIFLEYSSDGGNAWTYLSSELDPAGSFVWHTDSVRDGARYLLRAVAYTSDFSKYACSVSDAYLTINNPGNAQPEVQLFSPAEGTILRTSPLTIGWNAVDADNNPLSVTLFDATSQQGPFTQIHSGVYPNGMNNYVWDLSAVPNAQFHYLKITVSDGVAESSYVSRGFYIDQQAGLYADTIFHHMVGKATPNLKLQVTDPPRLTGHKYEMTFAITPPDTVKRLTVNDLTLGSVALASWPLQAGLSTPVFDGVKLTVTEIPVDVDTLNSGFARSELDTTVNFRWTNILTSNRKKVPQDWVLAFNSMDTLPNGHYAFPGDTGLNNFGRKVVVCPFHLINIDSMAVGRFFVDGSVRQDSTWQPGEAIVLLLPGSPIQTTYQVNFDFSSGLKPGAGDTLWVRTFKPITSADVFQFTTGNSYVLGAPGPVLPGSFMLYNNYPNPFNPSTTIRYELPKSSMVRLSVYDILGREVSVLVNEKKNAGSYEVRFDATGWSSGVYFYRLQARPIDGGQARQIDGGQAHQIDGGQAHQIDGGQAGDFMQTHKMLLVR
jgi:hypothetical protein